MEIVERSSNWILLKDKENFYCNVRVCCGLVDHSVIIMLTAEEATTLNLEGTSYLDKFASKVESKYGYPLRRGSFDVVNALVSNDVREKISKALA
jgi:hypothetical protein